MTTAYVESSAAAKLVLREPDSDTLRLSLRSHDHLVSSDLTRLEVTRAAWRAAGDTGLAQARAALLPIDTIPIERAIVDGAVRLGPPRLRSLDAIHVATALDLADDELTFYSYDQRTLEAARAAGLTVASPTP